MHSLTVGQERAASRLSASVARLPSLVGDAMRMLGADSSRIAGAIINIIMDTIDAEDVWRIDPYRNRARHLEMLIGIYLGLVKDLVPDLEPPFQAGLRGKNGKLLFNEP